jgi:carboxymethylenebutenolidase
MTDEPLPMDRSWVGMSGVTRRAAIVGSAFAAGFAAACKPVAATTMRTDAKGIDEAMASVAGDDGFAIPLYYARPRARRAPVVLVVHEIFGVHEWIKDICRRFAKAGYMAIAPDLYARYGDATKIADFKTLIGTIVAKVPDSGVMADLDRAAAWAADNGGDVARTGITGFCWGGRIVWLYAAHSRALDAGVAFYGALDRPTNALTPTMPIGIVDRLRAPVLGLYGGRDQGIPVADTERMNALLKAAGSRSHITLYPEADHGFLADYRPSYNEAAAKAAWAATLGWFGRYLR